MNGNDELKTNARKALRMKKEAAPDHNIPEHQTAHEGDIQEAQVSPTDTSVGKEPTWTPNLKRSHNARTGDA